MVRSWNEPLNNQTRFDKLIVFTRTYSEHFNLASNVSKQVDPRRTVTFLVIVLGARSLKTQRDQTNKHSHEMHSQWAIFTCANMQTWIKSRYIQLLVDWIFAFFLFNNNGNCFVITDFNYQTRTVNKKQTGTIHTRTYFYKLNVF